MSKLTELTMAKVGLTPSTFFLPATVTFQYAHPSGDSTGASAQVALLVWLTRGISPVPGRPAGRAGRTGTQRCRGLEGPAPL